MFFALYQHELVKQIERNQESGTGGRGINAMMKYLEGIVFIPFEAEVVEQNEKPGVTSDFAAGSDRSILQNASKRFKEIFPGKSPSHPKYDRLIGEILSKKDKSLVFVRRIPSVLEISQRVLEVSDQTMWGKIKQTLEVDLKVERLTRANFNKVTGKDELLVQEEIEGATETEGTEDEEIKIPKSKVLELFKVIKKDKSTSASNFRLRFGKSSSSPFAILFHPGSDYLFKHYEQLPLLHVQEKEKAVVSYYYSVVSQRTEGINNGLSTLIRSCLIPKLQLDSAFRTLEDPLPTLLTIFWEVLKVDEKIPLKKVKEIEDTYRGFSEYEKEGFSNFIEKGITLASEGIVDLFNVYNEVYKTSQELKPLQFYIHFCKLLKDRLKDFRMYEQIQQAILDFKILYSKVFNLTDSEELIVEAWSNFKNGQPIYPYNGDNKNEYVLKSFNTPFYPDVLVATSVLQEGVNLQYYCDQVYHYGMAWTPGDNEQRNGRIDRMFGKIEKKLKENTNSRLDIRYPYLEDTIDEQQLGRFIKRKYFEENLIDKGYTVEEPVTDGYSTGTIDGWQNYLRKAKEFELSDPYPATMEDFKGIPIKTINDPILSLEIYLDSIAAALNTVNTLSTVAPEVYKISNGIASKLVVNPHLNNNRNQPVVVEILLDKIASGFNSSPIYTVVLKTPIGQQNEFRKIKDALQNPEVKVLYTEGVKVCMNPNDKSSKWGIYGKVELPLFIKNLSENPLSEVEIKMSFEKLVNCCDQIEKVCFQNQDLSLEDLNLKVEKPVSDYRYHLRSNAKTEENDWKSRGEYLYLEEPMEGVNDRDAMIYNHQYMYVKGFRNDKGMFAQVAFLEKDAQRKELSVLEKHLEVYFR